MSDGIENTQNSEMLYSKNGHSLYHDDENRFCSDFLMLKFFGKVSNLA